MTIKVTLLLSTTLFECWLSNIYFGYHCARAQQFFDSAKDSRLFCKALYLQLGKWETYTNHRVQQNSRWPNFPVMRSY